jgi:hypothetical protein
MVRVQPQSVKAQKKRKKTHKKQSQFITKSISV